MRWPWNGLFSTLPDTSGHHPMPLTQQGSEHAAALLFGVTLVLVLGTHSLDCK